PADEGLKFGATALMFPNRFFDPVAGSRLYNEFIEQYRLAEAVGFDGIMLNEHHNAPFCMQAKANVFAAILAAITERVKIVILGNPLPLAENPVRLAEELAETRKIFAPRERARAASHPLQRGRGGTLRQRRGLCDPRAHHRRADAKGLDPRP
ncbi:LLM class flavin-dependent oxidoreductase, partial [bacterium]|nr:LLM class flavin-dependent oxidoreductase [bacterium]